MKIATKMKINMGITLVMVILMSFSLVWTMREIDRANRNKEIIQEMREIATDRILLRDDFLLHQEARAAIQWQKKSEILLGLMEKASVRFTNEEDNILLQEARKDFDATFSGFSAIIQKYQKEKHRAQQAFAFDEMQSRLIGQVFLKAYELQDSLDRLYLSMERTVQKTRNQGGILILSIVLGGGAAIVVNSVLTYRTIVNRLTALQAGIGIIGGGDLDYRIETAGNDELADLARAGNDMAAGLKASLTSVDNLQQEIMERRRAEEAVREGEERWRDLFVRSRNAISIYEATDEGRDYIIRGFNPAAERIENVRRDDIVGKRVTDVFPGVEAFGLLAVFRRVWETGMPEPHDISLYRDQRISGWRENFVYRLRTGEFVAVYDDVTDRKQAK